MYSQTFDMLFLARVEVLPDSTLKIKDAQDSDTESAQGPHSLSKNPTFDIEINYDQPS